MRSAKELLHEIRKAVLQRLDDIIYHCQHQQFISNKLESVYLITKTDHQRNIIINQLSILFYEALKKESSESIIDIIKYLAQTSIILFRKMNTNFEYTRDNYKSDYHNFLDCFQAYFLYSEDICRKNKIDQLIQNKSLKKIHVISALIKHLIQITQEFFQNKISIFNQSITPKDVQHFHNQKSQIISSPINLIHSKQNKILSKISKKNILEDSGIHTKTRSQQIIANTTPTKLKSSNNQNKRFAYFKNNKNKKNTISIISGEGSNYYNQLMAQKKQLVSLNPKVTLLAEIRKNQNARKNDSLVTANLSPKSQVNVLLQNKFMTSNNSRQISRMLTPQKSTVVTPQSEKISLTKRKITKIVPNKPMETPLDKSQIFSKLYGFLDIEQQSVKPLIKIKSKQNSQQLKQAFMELRQRNKDFFREIQEQNQHKKFI